MIWILALIIFYCRVTLQEGVDHLEKPDETKVCVIGDDFCYPQCTFDGGWFPWSEWFEWNRLAKNWTKVGYGKIKWDRVKPDTVKLKCVDAGKQVRVDLRFVEPPVPLLRVDNLESGDGFVTLASTCVFSEGYNVKWHFDPLMTVYFLTVADKTLHTKLSLGSQSTAVYCSVLLNGYRYMSRGTELVNSEETVHPCQKSRRYLMSTRTRLSHVSVPEVEFLSTGPYSASWNILEGENASVRILWENGTEGDLRIDRVERDGLSAVAYVDNGSCVNLISRADLDCGNDFMALEARLEDRALYFVRRGNRSLEVNIYVHPTINVEVVVESFSPHGVILSCMYEGWLRGDEETIKSEDVSFVIQGQYEVAERRKTRMFVHCSCVHMSYPSHDSDGFPTCRFKVYCFAKSSFGRVFTSSEILVDAFQRRGRLLTKVPSHNEL